MLEIVLAILAGILLGFTIGIFTALAAMEER